VDVRFRHVQNTQPLGFRGGDVLLDVAIRIDNERFTSDRTAKGNWPGPGSRRKTV
jgi:hypothetical protein